MEASDVANFRTPRSDDRGLGGADALPDWAERMTAPWYQRVDWFKLGVWLGLAAFLCFFWWGVARAI